LKNKPKGKILRKLRSQYYDIKPTINIGKSGIDKVIEQIENQLKVREVVKVTINKNILRMEDRFNIAKQLQEKLKSGVIIDIRGRKILIARKSLVYPS